MRRRRNWLRGIATALSVLAGGAVAASATLPDSGVWVADPEEQFLLDVTIRQTRLGDGVRAYATPEGTCVLFGDFVTTLDLPIQVDLAKSTASGWAFHEENALHVDRNAATVKYHAGSEPLAPEAIRETPEGWCVDTTALGRWLGIAVKPVLSGSALVLQSKAKLPVELAIERQKRAAQIKPAKFDLKSLPQVRLPYRMWRAPALDFVVNAGVTYRAHDGVKVDRQSSVYAAGELAHLSYDAQISTDIRGKPSAIRVHAFRSDPEGGLLGPLKATHYGFGDVGGFDSRLTGMSVSGRGAVLTNRPLFAQTAFDRTRFEGELPSGWDAEIYRNGELLAFAKPNPSGRYVFEDVQLLYGENEVNIVLYGPQGQVRSRTEFVNVGQDNVPPGQTWYWAGANQPGRDMINLKKSDHSALPRAQAAVSVEHGIDERMSVGVLARTMLLDDERVTFVEGTVRRSVGAALVEVAAAGETSGGKAVRAQVLTKIGSVNVSAEAIAASAFHLRGEPAVTRKEVNLAIDAPIRIGRTVIPAHTNVSLRDEGRLGRSLEAAARLNAQIDRFNLAADLSYRKQLPNSGPAPPPDIIAGVIGAGRIGAVRVRGGAHWDVSPESRLRSIELTGYWSASDTVDWEAGAIWEGSAKRGIARVSHIRRFDALSLALTGEAATDGSVAVGLNVNFSLDPGHGFSMSRQPLANAGSIHARVYRDLNDNGARDPGEPFEKGALIAAGRRLSEKATDSEGTVLVGGLTPFLPTTVGIDESSLSDPMLVPKQALQVVVPRPGVPAEVEIGLSVGGDIEGALVKSGGLGLEGADVELIDASGKVVAVARTDLDGFFLFERVLYGTYRLRLTSETAVALGIPRDLSVTAVVNGGQPVARLGSIPIAAQRIAALDPGKGPTGSP